MGVVKVGGGDGLRAKAIISRVVVVGSVGRALLEEIEQFGEEDGKAEGREERAKGAALGKAFLLVEVVQIAF